MVDSNHPAHIQVDYDAPCVQCGYNLHGLPLSDLRCPECGTKYEPLSPMAAKQIERELCGVESRFRLGACVCAFTAPFTIVSLCSVPLLGADAGACTCFSAAGMFLIALVAMFGLPGVGNDAWRSALLHVLLRYFLFSAPSALLAALLIAQRPLNFGDSFWFYLCQGGYLIWLLPINVSKRGSLMGKWLARKVRTAVFLDVRRRG
ncbi:hypothetical protein RAS1_39500 [Phycisphaerae bacterium RAS1]|nr:hypothetical protein RAS1_39500 [Phycisphaerae bacterium RAS1]